MKHRIFALIAAVLLAFFPPVAFAQQDLIGDPETFEKKHFQQQCTNAQFGDNYVSRIDINNDGIIDAVVNEGELICDGVKGPDCDADGCPYNFYLQVKEGGYFMMATARIYGYDYIRRYGNMVFVMKMHPRFCDRTDSAPCEMTVRVRGTKMVTLFKK